MLIPLLTMYNFSNAHAECPINTGTYIYDKYIKLAKERKFSAVFTRKMVKVKGDTSMAALQKLDSLLLQAANTD